MSDIVMLTNDGCQAGCREDEVAQTIKTLMSPALRRCEADTKLKAGATGFGI
jgi:hypothetical protein